MADFEEFENKLADIVRNVPHEEFIYEFLNTNAAKGLFL